MSRRKWFQMLIVTVVTACLLVLSGTASAQGNSGNAFERVKAVQERHTAKLMAKEGVVGTAIGVDYKGDHAILVLLEKPGVAGVPTDLEGVSVQPVVTGKIYALPKPAQPVRSPKPPAINPKAWFPRPVPIGVSTGNAAATNWATGTIGCRVKDTSGAVYALSNNHVYALENTAPIDSEVLQPGLYDTQGVYSSANVIGTLKNNYVRIDFSGSASNTVDAAIAAIRSVTYANGTIGPAVGNATPSNGYRTPSSTVIAASVGQLVQKYGRTTSLTKGRVYAINAIVNVGYSTGTATFIEQIIITPATFSAGGDSGSLIVTQTGNNPVGLLFAGSTSYTVANPIGLVLAKLSVTVDGQ